MRARVDLFVVLTIFLDLIGFGIVLPLLPLYVANMGGTAETVGVLFACFSFTQLLATPWLGRLSDKFGRRPVILISLAGNALAMVVFALATRASLLPLLFLSRIVAGATSGNIAACQAAISDAYTGDERAQGMGRVGAAIGLGMVCGPVAGGMLAHYGAWAPPAGAATLALLDLVAAFFFMPETRHLRDDSTQRPHGPPVRLWTAVRDPEVSGILIVFFLLFLALSAMQVSLPLVAQEWAGWGPVEVGRMFGAFGLMSLLVQGIFLRPLLRRVRAARLAVVGPCLIAGGMLTLLTFGGARGLVLGVVPLGIGFGITSPVLSTAAAEHAPPESQGAILGLTQSASGLARTIGPLLAGTLQARLAHGAPFVSAAICAAGCALVSAALERRSTARAAT